MGQKSSDHQLWAESKFAAIAGGSYFNPVKLLIISGREIIARSITSPDPMNLTIGGEPTYLTSQLFETLASHIGPGECLFGIYRRGANLLAPYLPDAIWLVNYEVQVQSGYLELLGYYAASDELADRGLAEPFP